MTGVLILGVVIGLCVALAGGVLLFTSSNPGDWSRLAWRDEIKRNRR